MTANGENLDTLGSSAKPHKQTDIKLDRNIAVHLKSKTDKGLETPCSPTREPWSDNDENKCSNFWLTHTVNTDSTNSYSSEDLDDVFYDDDHYKNSRPFSRTQPQKFSNVRCSPLELGTDHNMYYHTQSINYPENQINQISAVPVHCGYYTYYSAINRQIISVFQLPSIMGMGTNNLQYGYPKRFCVEIHPIELPM